MSSLTIPRSNPHTFQEFLSGEDGPAVAIRPGKATIYDAKSQQVYQTEVFRSEQPGFFFFAWTPPGRDPVNPYKLVWQVATAEGLVSHSSSFDIEEEVRDDFSFQTMVTQGFKKLKLNVMDIGQAEIKLINARTSSVTYTAYANFERVGENVIPIDSDIPPGDYLVTISWNNVNIEDQLINLAVASLKFYSFMPRFRADLDRTKYPGFDIRAWNDSHIHSWFKQAYDLINSYPPLTISIGWNTQGAGTISQDALENLVFIGAKYYALRSQFLLENGLAFDYSGPNVNISHDKTGGIESEIGRLKEIGRAHV